MRVLNVFHFMNPLSTTRTSNLLHFIALSSTTSTSTSTSSVKKEETIFYLFELKMEQMTGFVLLGLVLCGVLVLSPTTSFGFILNGMKRQTLFDSAIVPTDVLFLSAKRFLYSEGNGAIYVCDISSGNFQRQLYMDMSSVVSFEGNKGIQDMILDIDFATTQKIYIYYSHNANLGPQGQPGNTHYVSTFSHLENQGGLTPRAYLNSEQVLWVDPDGYPLDLPGGLHWHFGGQFSWGPDDKLYFAQGDKMIDQNYAQDITHPAGCIIRMNKDGSFPPDNYGALNGGHPACWGANGLRSPWRTKWDLPTARFIIGDVGGNDQDTAYEEIHIYKSSMGFVCFGWPWCDGSHCGYIGPNYVMPVLEWAHNGSPAAVIGGFVYRGQMFGAPFQESYIFGDYGQQWLKIAQFDSSGLAITNTILIDDTVGPLTTIEESPDGSFIVTNLDGMIYRYSADTGIATTAAPTTTTTTTTTTTVPQVVTVPHSNVPVQINFDTVPANTVGLLVIDGKVVQLPYTLDTFIHAFHDIEAYDDYCHYSGQFYQVKGWNWGGPNRRTLKVSYAYRDWKIYYNTASNPQSHNCYPH
eukprot:m.13347 g.13347  ORF g.13347 m.13347 type:complete len:580 (-) comp4144_c0_seq1:177-1916(-)